ncbi:MipA/OmpV family protein [Rheinheimera sediminis]|uniref:MipA/OmpV family protein n=1 Tax=Rheinheimera sp. YQF-1 TaxID=2499626 RepID=UPI000FDB5073|nr:MipA/OmpV family protein [Rheinheimera sp. YQF-1]RVT44753.1 MipA/OmpV family protein [Rheinheimera sp. YQF-1]
MKSAAWLFLFCLLGSSTAFACATGEERCVAPDQFQLSVALGAGQRSNPLHDGDSFPMLILPDFSYYTDSWFIDNGTLGYSLRQNEQFAASIVVRLNAEKGYFQRWFAGNLLTMNTAGTQLPPEVDVGTEKSLAAVSISHVKKRPTAVDAGIQFDWFAEQWQGRLNLWQDLSSKYQGQNASLSWTKIWSLGGGHFDLNATLYWKSARLIDTYYGVDEDDLYYLQRYQGRASWQPEVRFGWQRALNQRWSLLTFFRYLHLDDAMTDSPLVRDDSVQTWFVGVGYRFF